MSVSLQQLHQSGCEKQVGFFGRAQLPSVPAASGLYVAIFYFVALHKGFHPSREHNAPLLFQPLLLTFHSLFLIFKTRKSAHYELDSKTIITQDRKT
jgi:hypothetical protein